MKKAIGYNTPGLVQELFECGVYQKSIELFIKKRYERCVARDLTKR